MERDILVALFNNATLLLALSLIYEVVYILPIRNRHLQLALIGILIALTCSAVMSMPFTLQSGIIFDTRSILISVTALFFGAIPTLITVITAIILRLSIGGAGALPGIAVIFSSALIGLVWRHWVYPKASKLRWLNIFAMSVCVHLVMLGCMLLLPYPDSKNVIISTVFPVMLIYPIATVLLSLLLIRQQMLKQTQVQLKQSEERFKLLFDKAPLGYQSLDADGYFVEVNQQWCDLLGYPREEVIGKWFGDFLSPDNKEAFRKRFPIFKSQGFIHSEFEVLHKSGTPLFIAFEGRIGYDAEGEFKQTHCILQDITNQKVAESALIESEKKYRNIAENMSDVVWQTDLNLHTFYISPSVEKLFGETPEEHMKRKTEDKFPEHTIVKVRKLLLEELEKEKDPREDKKRSRTIEVEQYRVDGTIIWIEMSISITRDENEDATGFLGVSRDITHRKLAELALMESERSKTLLISNLPGLAYRCKYDQDGTMLVVSYGCYALTGYLPESFINNKDLSFNDIINPEHRSMLWREWERAVPRRTPYRCEYEISTAQGEKKWVIEMGQGVYRYDGSVEALEGIILDISDRKEMENNLRYINEHDRLTGLYNRGYLEEILEQDHTVKHDHKRALISINLSMIQLLTANYGFHYTQKLIQKSAKALQVYCSSGRMLFSTYENRFVLYITDYTEKAELTHIADDIIKTLEDVYVTDRVGVGIGVLEIDRDNDETNIDVLLRRLLITSERALSGVDKGSNISFYDHDLEAIVHRESEIRKELSRIADGTDTSALYLQYQPILDLKTNSICSFEALARLRTARLGYVSPMEFIPIAEKTKMIIPIGKEIIVQAFQFLKRINQIRHEAVSVAINVSAIQLLRPDFTSGLLELIQKMQVNPRNIGIEITESVFSSDYDYINSVILELRDSGLHIAIDDFGTGYSSLRRERELNVNSLKIDKYFIDTLLEDGPQRAITGDIISIAHRLGHSVIAEGVEHEDQRHYLETHDCDMIQGYLISRPLDEDAAVQLLSS